MKLNLKSRSEKWEEEKAHKRQWHKWFAWYPVQVGKGDYRWLETVYREGTLIVGWEDYYWMYRYSSNSPEEV